MAIEFPKVVGCSSLAFLVTATVNMSVIPSHAGEQIFDELRFGASASIQGGGEHEDGIFPEVTVFFDPFGQDSATGFEQQLLRPRSSIAMLMCDIDEFKKLNDTLGHAEGDRCLVKVAGIIQSSLRSEQDQVARFGGEEFLVLLPNSSEEDARSVAETIRSRVEAAALANPSSRVAPCVTISVGVAAGTVDREAISPDQLQRRADASLYDAKTNGRNQVAVCKDYG